MMEFTVLCISLAVMGHAHTALGIAYALRKRGHRIVFATERNFVGFFANQGFEEKIFDEKERREDDGMAKEWSEWVVKNIQYVGKPPIESYSMIPNAYSNIIDHVMFSNSRIEEIVREVQPNVIIEDRLFVPIPALISSGIPIIKITSTNPLLGMNDTRVPPAFFGLPITDNSEWEKCREIARAALRKQMIRLNKWFGELNNQIKNNLPILFPNEELREYQSTNLNILVYPEAAMADYLKLSSLPERIMRLDHSLRETKENFELPEKLTKIEGRIIYFSLGTVANGMIDLIQKFVDIFAKTKYRLVASLGSLSNEYKLPDNVWGAAYVPQLKVLPLIDLVLTHGGNNTFTESLYFGKAMIVFPLFGDQFDNAQRVTEMNIGHSFNPFTVEANELVATIESLLENEQVQQNVKEISQQMKKSDSMDKVVERIEFVANHPVIPAIV